MTDNAVSEVLLHTQDMMMVVIEQNWDDFKNMQLVQDEMLKLLFATDKVIFSDQEKDDLFEVQRLNKEILNAAVSHRTDVGHELRAMRKGKNKAGAYKKFGS